MNASKIARARSSLVVWKIRAVTPTKTVVPGSSATTLWVRCLSDSGSSSSSTPSTPSIAPIPPSARRAAAETGVIGGGPKPKFRIYVHVLAYTLVLVPVFVYAWYADRTAMPKEELEKELRRRYGAEIAEQEQNRAAMQEFFRNTILNPESGVEDERLKQVLYGGMGRNQKRFYEVDKKLHGTPEGQEVARQTQEELQREAEARKARRLERRRKKKEQQQLELQEAAAATEKQQQSVIVAKLKALGEKVDAKQVATVAVVGSVAAAVGFLLGGGRRN